MSENIQFSPWLDSSQKPYIQIQNVTKRFGEFTAIDNLTLDIYKNEFFSLLGPSGCGKTTLLRMLAGFEKITHGKILLDGEDISEIPPHLRPINMMFAIRPEKLEISKVAPSDDHNILKGTIEDIAYGGSFSTYHVKLDNGRILKAIRANRERTKEHHLTWDDEVYLQWAPHSAVVLLS